MLLQEMEIPPPDEERCKRTATPNWRCKERAWNGQSMCEKHFFQGKLRLQILNKSRVEEEEEEEAERVDGVSGGFDGNSCGAGEMGQCRSEQNLMGIQDGEGIGGEEDVLVQFGGVGGGNGGVSEMGQWRVEQELMGNEDVSEIDGEGVLGRFGVVGSEIGDEQKLRQSEDDVAEVDGKDVLFGLFGEIGSENGGEGDLGQCRVEQKLRQIEDTAEIVGGGSQMGRSGCEEKPRQIEDSPMIGGGEEVGQSGGNGGNSVLDREDSRGGVDDKSVRSLIIDGKEAKGQCGADESKKISIYSDYEEILRLFNQVFALNGEEGGEFFLDGNGCQSGVDEVWGTKNKIKVVGGKQGQGLMGEAEKNLILGDVGGYIGGTSGTEHVVKPKDRRGRPKGSKNERRNGGVVGGIGSRNKVAKPKDKRGRPKGSKNKKKLVDEKDQMVLLGNVIEVIGANSGENEVVNPKDRRGRPKGSKNKRKKVVGGEREEGFVGEGDSRVVLGNADEIIGLSGGGDEIVKTKHKRKSNRKPAPPKGWKKKKTIVEGEEKQEVFASNYCGDGIGLEVVKIDVAVIEDKENKGRAVETASCNNGQNEIEESKGLKNERTGLGYKEANKCRSGEVAGSNDGVEMVRKRGRPKGSKSKRPILGNDGGEESGKPKLGRPKGPKAKRVILAGRVLHKILAERHENLISCAKIKEEEDDLKNAMNVSGECASDLNEKRISDSELLAEKRRRGRPRKLSVQQTDSSGIGQGKITENEVSSGLPLSSIGN